MTDLAASLSLRLVDLVSGEAQKVAGSLGGVAGSARAATQAANTAIQGSSQATRLAVVNARRSLRELASAEPEMARAARFALDQIVASGELTEAQIQAVAADVRGLATQSTAEFRRIARENAAAQRSAQSATARAARGSQRNLLGISKASQNAGREAGALVNVVAELGFSLGAAVPGMRQLGTEMAIMGGTAFQLGAAFGVPGAAIGVITGLIPTAISQLGLFQDEMNETAESAENLAERFTSLAGAIDARREAAERLIAAQNADGTAAEQEALVQQATLRQDAARRQVESFDDFSGDFVGFGPSDERRRRALAAGRRAVRESAGLLSVDQLREAIRAADLSARGVDPARRGVLDITTEADLRPLLEALIEEDAAVADVASARELRERAADRRARAEETRDEKNKNTADRPGTPAPVETEIVRAGVVPETEQIADAVRRGMESATIGIRVQADPGTSVTQTSSSGPVGVTLDQLTPTE